MLIDLLNAKVGTTERLVCVSRPRRFGKSFAAQMLCTYYDCSCDSHALFEATINGDDAAVAEQIELIHREETSPLHYNKGKIASAALSSSHTTPTEIAMCSGKNFLPVRAMQM